MMNNGMIAESLPAWLTNLYPRFQESGVFDGLHPTLNEPNHCLVNEYFAGQGILVSSLIVSIHLGSMDKCYSPFEKISRSFSHIRMDQHICQPWRQCRCHRTASLSFTSVLQTRNQRWTNRATVEARTRSSRSWCSRGPCWFSKKTSTRLTCMESERPLSTTWPKATS